MSQTKRIGPRLIWVWSCLVPCVPPAFPLLWTNGRPHRSVTEILQKGARETSAVFHTILSVAQGGRGVCVYVFVPEVNSFSQTC